MTGGAWMPRRRGCESDIGRLGSKACKCGEMLIITMEPCAMHVFMVWMICNNRPMTRVLNAHLYVVHAEPACTSGDTTETWPIASE